MLVLHNVRMVPSNVKKKNKKTTKCEKKNKGTTGYDKSIVICDVDTAQCEDDIIKYEKKKKKRTTECDKSTFTCDVNTAQCENSTIECEKKIMKLPNVTKV